MPVDPLLLPTSTYNILIEQGQPFARTIKIKNENVYTDLRPYTFKSEIRVKDSISSTLITQINCSINSEDFTELFLSQPNTANIKANITGITPNNFILLPPDRLPKTLYYWSLRAFINSIPVSRILSGLCAVTPEITSE